MSEKVGERVTERVAERAGERMLERAGERAVERAAGKDRRIPAAVKCASSGHSFLCCLSSMYLYTA